jgi:DNA-binding HxlR family transcriptional regulator
MTAHGPYSCGLDAALDIVGGKWKSLILWALAEKPALRFGELRREVAGITEKMLIQQLRQMEKDGIVRRIVHHQVPPKVEYGLTDWGQSLCPALDALLKWAALRHDGSSAQPAPLGRKRTVRRG